MLAAALVLAAVVGMTGFALWRYLRAPRPDWQPVPGHALVRCAVPDGVTPADVSRALRLALESLADLGPWDSTRLQAAVARLDVYVLGTDAWVDGWGRRVAGLQLGRALTVGRNLAGLCHEVAHLAESVLDGAVDETHESWVARGIRGAEVDYQRRLGGGA